MPTTWKFYADAGGTTEVTTLLSQQAQGGAPADRKVYFMSLASLKTLQAASAPGADPITVTPEDTNTEGGMPASAVKLALSAAGLDSAVGGAPLTIGTTLNSGTAGAREIHVRIDFNPTVAVYSDVRLTTNAVQEA